MKRFLAWICGLLSAIGITACDYINVKELQPGVSTSAEVRERFASLGLEPGSGSAADLQKTMQDDIRRWGPIVKKSGFRAD